MCQEHHEFHVDYDFGSLYHIQYEISGSETNKHREFNGTFNGDFWLIL